MPLPRATTYRLTLTPFVSRPTHQFSKAQYETGNANKHREMIGSNSQTFYKQITCLATYGAESRDA